MTEIFSRRQRARSQRVPIRTMATLAAVTTLGGVLPLVAAALPAAAAPAAATASCAPTSLAPNAAPTATSPELKDVVLTWNAPTDLPVGTKYDLQFSSDQDYATNLAFSATTNLTRYVLPVLALPHGSYFWRVKVDGRSCWSDDAGSAAEFTTGWRSSSTLVFPADGGTVDAADFHLSWLPVAEASSYLVQVYDSSGTSQGICITQNTTFSPYDVPSDSQTDGERTTKNAACSIAPLASGSYTWRVLPLDDTQVADLTAPYKGVYGESRDPKAVAAHDAATITALASDIGAPSATRSFTIGGAPATSSTMSINASEAGNGAGGWGVNCDVADSATPCTTTPTVHWTAITGATSYRVTLAMDQHFTNNVRVYDTAYDNVTPIDQLLDSQAGQAYFIRVCSDTDICNVVDSDSPTTYSGTPASSVPSFAKQTGPLQSLAVTTSTSLNAALAQVTLGWSDPASSALQTTTADYEVQVAGTCDFSTVASAYTTDVPEATDVFAAGVHYWRVRAIDASGSPGPWSDGNSSTPVCSPSARFFTITAPAGSVGASGSKGSSVVDVTSSSVKKSGHWVKRNARGASSGSALVTDGTKKQGLTFGFYGTTVSVSYCKGPMDGYFSVYVDGKLAKTMSSYQAFTACGKTFTVGKLSSTKFHKLVVQASNKKGSLHGARQVVVDYVKFS